MNLKSTLGLAAATATAAVGVVGLSLTGTAAASPMAPQAPLAPVTCSFQTLNTGNFVTAVGGGGQTTDVIHTNATRVGSWERFAHRLRRRQPRHALRAADRHRKLPHRGQRGRRPPT